MHVKQTDSNKHTRGSACFKLSLLRPSFIVVVRDVCPSCRLSSVEIIYVRGNSLSNRAIDLKIGLNVREGVVHVRKA